MPPIHLLIKPSSGMCNLRCSYCFYEDESENRSTKSYGFMSRETLENVIRKALSRAEGSCTIAWQGGEPTLIGLPFFEYAMELIDKYNTKNLQIHHAIQTNGYHLGEDWARFFANHHFLVGLSLDGSKDTHNAFRVAPDGSGTFFDIIETKDLFERFGVDYNILTVVNARTAKKAGKIYDFYKKHGMRYLQFIPCLDPFYEDAASHPEWEFSLSAEAYGQFLMELFDRWYADALAGTQPYIRAFENYVGILAGYPPEACDQGGICSIQHVVEADGSVYPCDFYVLDDYLLGNLNTDELSAIEEQRTRIRFREISREQLAVCRDCPYFAICRGGCRRHRTAGTVLEAGPARNRFCDSYRMFFDHALGRLQMLARQVPPAR